MYVENEDVFYYVTIHNENQPMPPKPDGVDEGILRGIYRLHAAPDLGAAAPRGRLVGSGSILAQVVAARDLLAERFGVAAEVYSAPSFQLLRRDAVVAERWNRLHPEAAARVPYVTQVLGPDGGPVVAATDWLKAIPDQVARWVPAPFVPLGTDGYGRSDTREALRAFFEVDAPSIAYAAVRALEDVGGVAAGTAARALTELGIDAEKEDPLAL
jgi:pyruvate dehydrogenase E1 component